MEVVVGAIDRRTVPPNEFHRRQAALASTGRASNVCLPFHLRSKGSNDEAIGVRADAEHSGHPFARPIALIERAQAKC